MPENKSALDNLIDDPRIQELCQELVNRIHGTLPAPVCPIRMFNEVAGHLTNALRLHTGGLTVDQEMSLGCSFLGTQITLAADVMNMDIAPHPRGIAGVRVFLLNTAMQQMAPVLTAKENLKPHRIEAARPQPRKEAS